MLTQDQIREFRQQVTQRHSRNRDHLCREIFLQDGPLEGVRVFVESHWGEGAIQIYNFLLLSGWVEASYRRDAQGRWFFAGWELKEATSDDGGFVERRKPVVKSVRK